MKKILLLLAFAMFQFINAQAPTVSWQKCYGGSRDDQVADVTATPDGGYIMCGATGDRDKVDTGEFRNTEILVIKVNQTGIVQWQKNYGGSGEDDFHSIIPTADGGFLLAGDTDSNDGNISGNHGGFDVCLIKIDAVGTILWQKCLGGDSNEYLSNIIPTSDGGYIAGGYTASRNNGDVLGNTNNGGWVVKINNLGVIQWQKVYDNSGSRDFSSILQTADGGYVLCGNFKNSSLANYYNYDVLIIKVNQGGNIQWQNSYGGSKDDRAQNVILSNDGGYMVTAQTESNDGDVYGNHGGVDIWIFKISNTGVILGQNCYGGSGDDYGWTQETLDGGYLISGASNSNDENIIGNNGGYDMFAIKLSATNNIQWNKCYGGAGDDFGGFLQLSDGTYLAVGSTRSNFGDSFANLTNTTSDMFLIKLTAANLANKNFVFNTTKTYPNPTKNILHIDIETALLGKITDLAGKTLMNVSTKDIDLSSLSAGIYLLDIVSDDKRYVSKIVKE